MRKIEKMERVACSCFIGHDIQNKNNSLKNPNMNNQSSSLKSRNISDDCIVELFQVVNSTDASYIRNDRFFQKENMISTQVGTQMCFKAVKDIGSNTELMTSLSEVEPQNEQIKTQENPCEKIVKKRSHSENDNETGASSHDDNNDGDNDGEEMKLKKRKENVSEISSENITMETEETSRNNSDDGPNETAVKIPKPSLPNTRQSNKQRKDANTEQEFYYFFETRQVDVIENKGTKLYKCDVCKGVYRYAFSLKRHFLRTHINWKYLSEADISNCMINVVQQDMVAKRQPVPTGRRAKNSSSQANNRASSKPNFVSNSVSHSELYRCSLCSDLFDYIEDLVEHTHHHMTSPPSLAAMVPVKTQLVCATCNMKFTYKQNFIRHQAVHTGERPFQCEFCLRTFPTEISRKQHIRIHIFNTKNKTVSKSSSSSNGSNGSSNTNNGDKNSSTITNNKINNNKKKSNNSTNSSNSTSKITSAPVVKPTVKPEPVAEVTSEDLKCQICGKVFSCSSFLNKHIVCMHNGAMKRKANQNRRANPQKEIPPPPPPTPPPPPPTPLPSTSTKTEPVEETSSAIKSEPPTEVVKDLKTSKKTKRTKYACSICQRKFRLYVQLCRHKRAAHNKTLTANKKPGFYDLEKTGFENELLPGDVEAPFLELKDVAENVALNLTSFIDGHIDSLLDFTKYVKINPYTSVHEHNPDSAKETDIVWSQYNFPASFKMPVEESNNLVVTSTSDNPSTYVPSLVTTSMPSDLNNDDNSICRLSSTNVSVDTASVNYCKTSTLSSSFVDGRQNCKNVESEEKSEEKSGLLSPTSSSSSSLTSSSSPSSSKCNLLIEAGTTLPNQISSNSQNICDIPIVSQSSVIDNMTVVMTADRSSVVSEITTPTSSALILSSSSSSFTDNLTNAPVCHLPSVDDSKIYDASSSIKDEPQIGNTSLPYHPNQSGSGLPNMGETTNSGLTKPSKSVRFQSAFLLHEFSPDGPTTPDTSAAVIKSEPDKKELLHEPNMKSYFSLTDEKIKSNSDVCATLVKKSSTDVPHEKSSADFPHDKKKSLLPSVHSPTNSTKPSVQKDILFSGPHMMTAHIHERGHMVLEFGNDEEISAKLKNTHQSEESSKAISLKSHGLVKKSKKNENLLDFTIQHIVKMRVQEYKDYIRKNNPTLKLDGNPLENKEFVNNDPCLARYPSCSAASKFGDSIDKTNGDFNKISTFFKNGLLPHERLKELKKSVPTFSFGEKENWSPDYSQVAFGRHGIINYVCSICRKHFLFLDLCLRHQQHRHPSVECNFLEVELGNSIVALHYPFPDQNGLLTRSNIDFGVCKNLKVYKCSKCNSSFPSVTRLHSHIVRCATNPPDVTGITTNAIGKRKYKKRLKKRLRDVLNGSNTFKFRLKDFAGYDPTLFQENQVQRRRFRGCRSRKIVTVHETLLKTRKRRSNDLLYDPKNHVRRRECVEIVEKQQCRGCNVKFESISLLERHVPNCVRKDRLQNLKVLEGIRRTPSVRTVRPVHRCHYCNKQFTYFKSLCNHHLTCTLPTQQEQTGALQSGDLGKDRHQANLDGEESLESEQRLNVVRKGGWPKGLKRKFRRKNHSWTSIKRKRLKDSQYASKDEEDFKPLPDDSDVKIEIENKIEADVKKDDGMSKACLKQLLTSNTSKEGNNQKVGEFNNSSSSSSCGVQSTDVVYPGAELKASKPSFAYKTVASSNEKQWKNISESELYKQLTKNVSNSPGNTKTHSCQTEEIPGVNKHESSNLEDLKENTERLIVDIKNDDDDDDNSLSKESLDNVPNATKFTSELNRIQDYKSENQTTDYHEESLTDLLSLRKDVGISVNFEESENDSDAKISASSPLMHSVGSPCRKKRSECTNDSVLVEHRVCFEEGQNISEQVDQQMLPQDHQNALPLNTESVTEETPETKSVASRSLNDSTILNDEQDSTSSLPESLPQLPSPSSQLPPSPPEVDLPPPPSTAPTLLAPSSLQDSSRCELNAYSEHCQQPSLLATEEIGMPCSFETVVDIKPCEKMVASNEPVTMLSQNDIAKQDAEVSETCAVVEDDVVKNSCKTFEILHEKPNVVFTRAGDICQANVSSVEFVSHVADETATKFISNAGHLAPLTSQVLFSTGQVKELPSQVTFSNSPLPQLPTQMALSHGHLLQLPAHVTLSNAQLLQLPTHVALPNAQMSLSNVQLALSNTQLAQLPTQITLAGAHLTALPTHVAFSTPQLSTQLTLSNNQLTQLPTQMTLSNAHLAQIPTQVILSNTHLTQLPTDMSQQPVQVIPSGVEFTKAGTKLIWPQTELSQANIKLNQPQVDMNKSNQCPQTELSPTNASLLNRGLPILQTEIKLPNVEQIAAQVETNPVKPDLPLSNVLLVQPQSSGTKVLPLRPVTQPNTQQIPQPYVKIKSQFRGDNKQKKVGLNLPQVQFVSAHAGICQANNDFLMSEVKGTNVNAAHTLTQASAKLTMPEKEKGKSNTGIKKLIKSHDSLLSKENSMKSSTKLMTLNKQCRAAVSTTCVETSKTKSGEVANLRHHICSCANSVAPCNVYFSTSTSVSSFNAGTNVSSSLSVCTNVSSSLRAGTNVSSSFYAGTNVSRSFPSATNVFASFPAATSVSSPFSTVTPVTSSFPGVTSITSSSSSFPGVTPITSSFPGVTPVTSSFPGVAPVTSSFPGVTPVTSSFPAVKPVTSSLPAVTPVTSSFPVVTTVTSSFPGVTAVASSFPGVTAVASSFPGVTAPDVTTVTSSFPAVTPVTSSFPAVTPVTSSFPAVTPVTSSFPAVTPVTSSFPAVTPVTSSFPGATPVTSSFPGATPVTSSFPGVTPVTSSFPGVTPVTSSFPVVTPVTSSFPVVTPVTSSFPGVTSSFPGVTSSFPGVTAVTSSFSGVTPVTSSFPGVTPVTSSFPGVTPVTSSFSAVTPVTSFFPAVTPVTSSFPAVTPVTFSFSAVTPVTSSFSAVTPVTSSFPAVTPVTSSFSAVTPVTSSFSAVTPVTFSFPAVTPVTSSFPAVTPVTSSFPAVTPVTSSFPAVTPVTSSFPAVTPITSSFPAVTSSFPGVTPVTSSFPGVTPVTSSFPGVTPVTSSFPGVTPVTSSFPSVTTVTSSFPGVTAVTSSFSGVTPVTSSFPAVTSSFPAVTPVTSSFPAVTPVTSSFPAVTPVTSSFPAVTPVTSSFPAVTPVTSSVPAVTPVTSSVPAVTTVSRSFPAVITSFSTIPMSFPTVASISTSFPTVSTSLSGVASVSTSLPGVASVSTSLPGVASVSTSLPGVASVSTSLPGLASVSTSLPGLASVSTSLPGLASVSTSLPGLASVSTSHPGPASVSTLFSASSNVSLPFSTANELTRIEKVNKNLDNMEAEVDKSIFSLDVVTISKGLQQPKVCNNFVAGENLVVNSPSMPVNSSSENEFTPLTSLNFESELELEVVPEAIMEGDILYDDFPPSTYVAVTSNTLETPPNCRKSLLASAVPILNNKSSSSVISVRDLINCDPSFGVEGNNYVSIVPGMPLGQMSNIDKSRSPFIGYEDETRPSQTSQQKECHTESISSSDIITHLPLPTDVNNANIQK